MSAQTPRTRKQLREALHEAKGEARALRGAIWDADLGLIQSRRSSTGAHEARIAGAYTQKDLDEHREAAATEARREALAKVIDALELEGYAAHSDYTATLGADRLWRDINTALEHREAEKHAETVRKTAERVAGLTKKDEDKK